MHKSSLPVRRYALRGGVDVNMYNTLLEPDFALNVESENLTDEAEKAIWDRFNIDAYRNKVRELAIPLLEQQLQRLPSVLHVSLLPDSVSIYSPQDYSYGGDELLFSIEAQSDLSDADMQVLLNGIVYDDWNAEYLDMMVRIARKLPDTQFLCFTKKHELVNEHINANGKLPKNLILVLSAWGDFIPPNPHNLPMAYVRFRKGVAKIPDGARECQSYCGDCVATGASCWDLQLGNAVVFNEH